MPSLIKPPTVPHCTQKKSKPPALAYKTLWDLDLPPACTLHLPLSPPSDPSPTHASYLSSSPQPCPASGPLHCAVLSARNPFPKLFPSWLLQGLGVSKSPSLTTVIKVGVALGACQWEGFLAAPLPWPQTCPEIQGWTHCSFMATEGHIPLMVWEIPVRPQQSLHFRSGGTTGREDVDNLRSTM